jgi:hypothetical protein
VANVRSAAAAVLGHVAALSPGVAAEGAVEALRGKGAAGGPSDLFRVIKMVMERKYDPVIRQHVDFKEER